MKYFKLNRTAIALLLSCTVAVSLVGCDGQSDTEVVDGPTDVNYQKPSERRSEQAERPVKPGQEPETQSEETAREIVDQASDEAKAAADASNAFGIELFKQTTETSEAGNKFMSPVSAYLALAMAYNGATGETAAQMHQTLALGEISRDEVNAASQALMQTILGSDFEIGIGNSVWLRDGFEASTGYKKRVSEYYEATSKTLDFNSSEASKEINRWVDKQTRGRISEIVSDPLPSDLVALIVNAVYFKANWQQPFNAAHTRLGAFNAAEGVVDVPMMGGDGRFRYLKTDDAEWIELPYGGQNTLASMIIVKPAGDLDSFVEQLSAESWQRATAELDAVEPALGNISLPKLELAFEAELNRPLIAMGMPRAFSGSAQFDDLFEGDARLEISEVIQKTFLNVDEKGTEAAAVTSIGVRTTSIPIYKFNMVIDKPYFFVVRDNRTGAILFAGEIYKPEGGEMPAK